jgi:hypothetical protein
MKALRALATLLIAAISLTSLTTCKPITYYLAQVYKAYGKVTDAQTGDPLESVEVSVKGYQYSELTNGLGDYELELPEGTWTLEFAKDGYDIADSDPFTVGPTNPRTLVNAVLTPKALSIWGTWINPAYGSAPNGPPGKVIFNSDGTTVWYVHYNDSSFYDSGEYRIDSKLNDLYQIYFAGASSPTGEYFLLLKVASDGNTFEGNVDFTAYPPSINPSDPYYSYFTFSRE